MAKRKTTAKKTTAKKSATKKKTTTRKKTGSNPASVYAGKTLVVVEAPGKVQKIQGYLGPDYVVRPSVGHIMDLPRKGLGIDLENDYDPTYEVMDGKKDVVDELVNISKVVPLALIATDEDREGEFIGYSVAMKIQRKGLAIKRIKFNSITKAAIQKAVQSPTTLDKSLVRAQQGRRVLDRLVGFKGSPLLWSAVRKGLSAGRVQSVGLKIIVDRQKEIDAFNPVDFWTITTKLLAPNGDEFEAQVSEKGTVKKYDVEADAKAAVAALKKGSFSVKKVDQKPSSRKAPPAFTTSQLVQQASSILGWGAKRTNASAQQLYEAGMITYIRTDSQVIDPTAVKTIRAHIQSVGAAYLPKTAPKYKNKANAQEAHEAIRPTDLGVTPQSQVGVIPPDQQKLYEMIYKRAIASQSTPAQFDQVKVTIENSGIELVAKGQTQTFDGFLKFWTYSNTKEVILPPLAAGDAPTSNSVTSKKSTTKPPARYNTGSLIKELEESGVGRPATYQAIIETLLKRDYIVEDKKAFVPTPIGREVCDVLSEFLPRIVDVAFTAQMEAKLDEVANGQLDWVAAVDHFWKPLETEISDAGTALADRETTTDQLCLKCNSPLLRKVSAAGPFYLCSNHKPKKKKKSDPDPEEPAGGWCDGLFQIAEDGSPKEREIEVYHEKCRLCGADMVKKRGRKAGSKEFWGCSNYQLTKCGATCSLDGQWRLPGQEKEIMKCDKCGSKMIIRQSRRGPFVGCTAFPKCRNAKSLKELGIDADGNPVSST